MLCVYIYVIKVAYDCHFMCYVQRVELKLCLLGEFPDNRHGWLGFKNQLSMIYLSSGELHLRKAICDSECYYYY